MGAVLSRLGLCSTGVDFESCTTLPTNSETHKATSSPRGRYLGG